MQIAPVRSELCDEVEAKIKTIIEMPVCDELECVVQVELGVNVWDAVQDPVWAGIKSVIFNEVEELSCK